MPMYTRPGARSSTLAAALAVTTGWRLSGLVTQVPRRTRSVSRAIAPSVTQGSRKSAGESHTPMRSYPCASASAASVATPSAGPGVTLKPN